MSNSIYTFYVYAYIRSKDSINGKAGTPYYIGKGKGRRMYNKHAKNIAVPSDHRYIIILESNLSNIGALALERRYVKWYGRIDLGTGILHNLTDGGDGSFGVKMSEKTRERLSNAKKGKLKSEETKKRMSDAKRGAVMSEEQKKLLSKINKGKITSEETKKKLSEIRTGKPLSDYHKQRLSEAKKGKPLSEEHKQKLRDAQRARRNRELESLPVS